MPMDAELIKVGHLDFGASNAQKGQYLNIKCLLHTFHLLQSQAGFSDHIHRHVCNLRNVQGISCSDLLHCKLYCTVIDQTNFVSNFLRPDLVSP